MALNVRIRRWALATHAHKVLCHTYEPFVHTQMHGGHIFFNQSLEMIAWKMGLEETHEDLTKHKKKSSQFNYSFSYTT